MDDLAATALKLLDDLQLQESRLLSWGMVEGSFTEDELNVFAERAIAKCGLDIAPDEAIDWLEDRALLFALPEPEGHYRTRVAEGVRLFARLRQIFPNRPWNRAKELVADFRFATLPRRYPHRYIPVSEALDQLSATSSCNEFQKRVALQLLGGEGTKWELADFQVDATARVLAEARSDRATATIVCSGTGSGKTLAFYLPTFMHIADRMSTEPRTQCLAIYPRTELLRDQLKTAVQNALSVAVLLKQSRARPLSIGALYGAVPRDAGDLARPWHQKAWPNVLCGRQSARRSPYFDCPDSACNSALGWLDEDIKTETERLVCSRCGFEIRGEILRLTRKSMSRRPPDILFATTEMLNRGMSNRALWPLLGIGPNVTAPSLVLLDEVHTYGGIPGAQVGLTLRRWRHLAHAKPHFVGLSATLAEAPRFMAQLVGLYPNHVAVVEPRRLVTEGCEHIIALRGKPGTATLSTTIQSSMLLQRLMDTNSQPKTKGIAGSRIFVFTDNLDVTNRLYFDLADAEGWRQPARRTLADHPPLASARSSTNEASALRFRDGQSWDIAEEIGHDLGPNGRSIVGRTSSQDSSVDSNAQMVVATASLEVGFDDPFVGGIIQHQAPRDPAAYVQRKGRAGRSREMRPWAAVVLSDWGRDRLAYRSYEQLFAPEVPPRYLPVKNRHVLRIQAALSFMDWVTKHTPDSNLWSDLSEPGSKWNRDRQERIKKLIAKLLSDTQERERFVKHLQLSLGLDTEEEALALVWEPPRSLALAVWPTLLRRLEQQWQRSDGKREAYTRNHPMPKYVCRALFDDLNLPEVAISLGDGDDPPRMAIRQALVEYAPGRVSRRYGVAHAQDSHWVPPPETYVGELDIATFCPAEDSDALGAFQYLKDGVVTGVSVFRPYRFRTERPGRDINERSTSHPRWHRQIIIDGPGTSIPLPRGSVWIDLLRDLRFHSHVNGNPIEMRRFTTGAAVQIREARPPMRVFEGEITYCTGQEEHPVPAALGYSADIDGIVIDLSLPESVREIVTSNPALFRSVRVALFKDKLGRAKELDGVANVFQRKTLGDAYVALIVRLAERDGIDLEQARQRLAAGSERRILVEVLKTLRPADRVVGGVESDDDEAAVGDDFLELMENDIVRACLADAAKVLSRDLGLEDEPWIRRAIKATIGGAFLGAFQRLCPQVDAGDLFVELDAGPTVDGELPSDQVWFTEATVGGSGFVEAIQRACAEDPRRVIHLFEAELEPSDFEQVDYHLRLLLARLAPDNDDHDVEVADAFREIREATTFADQAARFERLLELLRALGIATSHSVVSAVALRLLRPGTGPATDRLSLACVRRRDEVEERHEFELDDRSFATLLAFDEQIGDELRAALPMLTGLDDPAERHSILLGVLWPRGAEVRQQSLAFWSPFENDTYCERLLLHALVPHAPMAVRIEDSNWREKLESGLLQDGLAALSAPLAQPGLLREAALDLAAEPIEADSLLLYPRVRKYKRDLGRAILVFDMPEALQ